MWNLEKEYIPWKGLKKPDCWLTTPDIDSKKRLLWITENIQKNKTIIEKILIFFNVDISLVEEWKQILAIRDDILDNIEKGKLYNIDFDLLQIYFNKWIIDSEEIKNRVRTFLINKWDEILQKIIAFKQNWRCLDYLSDEENKILFFCINNWYISHKMATLIPLDDWETIDKYIDKYCKKDLVKEYYKNLFFLERE